MRHIFGPPPQDKYGVLRKLKHIFPNTYQRINSICSPAKVGLVVTDFNYQAPRLSCHSLHDLE